MSWTIDTAWIIVINQYSLDCHLVRTIIVFRCWEGILIYNKFDTSSETRVTCWCVLVTNPIATLSPGIRVSANTSEKCRWVPSILPRVPTCLRTTCLSSMSRNTVTRKKFCLPNPFFTLSCGCILWRQMGLLSLMLNWHQDTPTNHHKNYSKGSKRLRSYI